LNYLKSIITALVLIFLNIFLAKAQTFTKVTSGSFVNDGSASRSVNFVDYDGDGDPDLFVSNGKRFGQFDFLYNNNNGVFTRVLGITLVLDSLPSDGSSWADIDNDGDLDLCVVSWYDSTNTLYKNDGNGNFTLLSSSPVYINRGFSETCSWGDFDNDGLVDLFITNSEGIGSWRNRLYKNTGGGNFVSIDTGAISLDLNRYSRGINWVDIDGDGDLDIFVSCENNQNELMYKNNGGGFFTKITNTSPVTDQGNSWSASWGDYDNDGDLDVFVANWGNQKNSLFRNDGNFNFTKVTNVTIVNENGYFACSGWGDFDNDGDLDMFVTQAYKTPNSPLKNNLYKNMLIETGNPTFEKITSGDIVNDAGYSYGFSWCDWDEDGDLDLFVAKTYNENENNAAYLNDGNANSWIEVTCRGTITNRSAIGSKVRIKAIINSHPVWQMREIDAQSGYCAENLVQHFGLGNASVIDSIKVEWLSGTVTVFTDIPVNQHVIISEDGSIIGLNTNKGDVPKEYNLYQNFPNPFNPSTKIRFNISSNAKRSKVQLVVFSILGEEVASLVNGVLNPGIYEVEWDASGYSSGIYYYRLETEKYSETKKMVLLK
jgi:hypothetical protein